MTQGIVRYSELKPATSCRFDAVALGEVMLRFDPFDIPTARARSMRVFQGVRSNASRYESIPESRSPLAIAASARAMIGATPADSAEAPDACFGSALPPTHAHDSARQATRSSAT